MIQVHIYESTDVLEILLRVLDADFCDVAYLVNVSVKKLGRFDATL